MKKVLKLLVAIIIAIVVLGGVMFLVDCSRGKSGKLPIFAISDNADTGLATSYNGLGYEIIHNWEYGGMVAYIGPWSIVLQESNYCAGVPNLNEDKDDNNIINDKQSGDIIIDNSVSGEIITSGDNVNIENVSGDVVSGDGEISTETSGDRIDTEIVTSGDKTLNQENASGDVENEKENEFVFEAVVIGVNNNNLIVQALENEAINASADMFSFSLNQENNSENIEFLIGQKVKIEYTGTIAESYPAQIKVVRIEIVE